MKLLYITVTAFQRLLSSFVALLFCSFGALPSLCRTQPGTRRNMARFFQRTNERGFFVSGTRYGTPHNMRLLFLYKLLVTPNDHGGKML